jgi:hypothetical protein
MNEPDDGLNAARGILTGMPIGAILWLIILSPWLLGG